MRSFLFVLGVWALMGQFSAPVAFACHHAEMTPDALEQKAEAMKKAATCLREAKTEEAKKECVTALHNECKDGDCPYSAGKKGKKDKKKPCCAEKGKDEKKAD